MTDGRDSRIRGLIVELAGSSPEAPTFAEIEDLAAESVGEGQVRPLRDIRPEADRGWLVALTAGVAVVVLVGGVALLLGGSETGDVGSGPTPSATVAPMSPPATSPTTTLPPSTTKAQAMPVQGVFELSAEINVGTGGAYVYDVAITPGWVWAVVQDENLYRINPATGSIDTTIALPSSAGANIEVDDGALWVIHGSTLTRIDPETAEVTGTIEIVGPWEGRMRQLAVGLDGVWVAAGNRVLRLDEDDIEISGELPLSVMPSGLVVGADSVWVLIYQDDVASVLRIDPTTLGIVATIPLQGSIFRPSLGTPMTYGHDAVWINASGLSRLDPKTDQVSIVLNDPNCCGPTAVGFTSDRIIAAGLLEDKNEIVIVDTDTGELETASDFRFDMGVFTIAGDTDSFWAAVNRTGTLYRFEISAEQP
jgi:glutamine cyclotransferase